MLLKFFKTSRPIVWVLIGLKITILRAVLFVLVFEKPQPAGHYISFDSFLLNITLYSPVLSHIISTVVALFSGWYFNQITQNIGILKGAHYLLVLFVCLFLSFNPENLVLSAPIATMPLLLYSYQLIYTQTKGDANQADVFNAAFAIGLASLVFFPSAILMVVLLIGLAYINQAGVRMFAIGIVGFATPYLFHDVLVFVFGSSKRLKMFEWMYNIGSFKPENYVPLYTFFGIIALLILQLAWYIKASSHTIIKIQKSLLLNLLYMVLGVVWVGFISFSENSFIDAVILPMSIFFSVFHLEVKQEWFSDLLFIALLAIMYINLFGI